MPLSHLRDSCVVPRSDASLGMVNAEIGEAVLANKCATEPSRDTKLEN